MEGQVAALAVRSQGRLGSIDRVRAEDGELLVDDPQLRVRRLGLAHDRSNTPAVRTVVVEELDERDVTVGIATHGTGGVLEDLVGPCPEYSIGLARRRGALAC